MDPILSAVALSKRFEKTKALDRVSLEVMAGEIVCVIGPNGAGKTTLIDVLSGQLIPDSGHVRVFGLDRWKESYEIRCLSMTVPVYTSFGMAESPAEYFQLIGEIYHMPESEFRTRSQTLISEMAFEKHARKSWDKLSLGLSKKTGLIGAFLPDLKLRFFDEPFAGGIDPLGMETLFQWMKLARQNGSTTIFSTQVLDHAQLVADRLILMEDGDISFFGTPSELILKAEVDPASERALYKAFVKIARVLPEE